LSLYAGLKDVRVAFVAENGSGNNMYIDNIEFFIERDPRDISINRLYSIFGYSKTSSLASSLKIGFNLDQRQTVKCEIYSTTGQLISAIEWSDVLNQVFDLPLDDYVSAGVYIVRINIDGRYTSELVLRPY